MMSIVLLATCSKKSIYMNTDGREYKERSYQPAPETNYELELAPYQNQESNKYSENQQLQSGMDSDEEPLRKMLDKDDSRSHDKHKMERKEQSPAGPAEKKIEQEKPRLQKKRMVTYEGIIQTRSSKPDSLIEKAVNLAESVKGFVQYKHDDTVILRIPLESFQVVYDSLLKLGEIIDHQKIAEDITDAFRDANLRIEILEKTIKRYIALIAMTKAEAEKINLLKEVERLREELEVLQVQKRALLSRASYATLHFIVQERTPAVSNIEMYAGEGFYWIRSLDPVYYPQFGKSLKLPVPKGMLYLKDKEGWMVESPGGTRMWAARIQNKPHGTSRFWIDAIYFRIREQYKTSDSSKIGDYQFIRFKPYPGSNFIYTIGLTTKEDEIHIVQIFFPDEDQESRYLKTIQSAITEESAS
jgi:hypothetical protein